jgi:transcriptional regulator with XRE-family HTH domain
MLKDIASEMGISPSYLLDIMRSRRSMPDKDGLDVVARILRLSEEEVEEMMDAVGREKAEAAPDLPECIMSEDLPHVRMALRKAKSRNLGDDFWQKVAAQIDGGGLYQDNKRQSHTFYQARRAARLIFRDAGQEWHLTSTDRPIWHLCRCLYFLLEVI